MNYIDLYLLPIAGGYIFLNTCKLTRYYHKICDRQRLIYNSSVAALILLIIAIIIDYFVQWLTGFSLFETNALKLIVGNIYYIDNTNTAIPSLQRLLSMFTFIYAFPLALIFNLLMSSRLIYKIIIKKWGNQVEQFLWNSLISDDPNGNLIQIVTKNNLTYIGYANKINKPIGDQYLSIMPHFGGFVSHDLQKTVINIFYQRQDHNSDEKENLVFLIPELIFPINEILVISKFDIVNLSIQANKSIIQLLPPDKVDNILHRIYNQDVKCLFT